MNIRAVPLTYNGTTYRSTLEADWAATFDFLGWYYEYEPEAVDLGDGERYLTDFHLRGQNVWCEVKGAHNQRMTKTRRLHRAIADPDQPGGEMVVILTAAGEPGRSANWKCATGNFGITINQCRYCEQWCFTQTKVDGLFCRYCENPEGLDPERQYVSAVWAHGFQQRMIKIHPEAPDRDFVGDLFGVHGHGRLPFATAPRRGRRGSA